MPFNLPSLSFVTRLFKQPNMDTEEGSSMNLENSDVETDLIQGSSIGEDEEVDNMNESQPVTMDTEEVQYIVEGALEEDGCTELVQLVDEESVIVEGEQEEALMLGEEGEVIEIMEDEFANFGEDGEAVLDENIPDTFLNTDLSHGEVIDEAQIVETVIDDRAGEYDDDDKENGEGILQTEYTEDTDAEPFVEITRRRLSHEGNCYCAKDRNLNIVELLCASCHRWYHESCIGYQLGKSVPFMMNYVFICKNCSPTGLESFKRTPAQITQMCVTAIANLTQSSVKDNTNRHRFSKDADIIPFIDMHWEGMTPARRLQSWHSAVNRTLVKESNSLFTIDNDPSDPNSPYFGLLALDLTQIRPNYEAMINSGLLKLSDLSAIRRGGGKRRTVSGIDIYAQSQASVAKKVKGDSFLAKSILGHGYPTEHPFNKDGFRYILAEPDSNAPFRQEFDESSDWAGKPIPGFLYRVLNPPFVFLALHDRAPQLKVSEDRLSVTGEKGYCMIRASHFVTKGSWYWEAKITELPESSACRIGWGQSYANLQAPLGFDKFGYSWRSRLGTRFHQACGKSYCPGGYTLGDVLGFMIILPEPQSHAKKIFAATDPPSVPDSFKDRPLVRFKSHLYYEDKDISAEVEVNETRKGSKIICFKNGVCQGVAYEDIYEGSYYPAVSIYKGCTVKLNFGPKFEHPPSQEKYNYKAERAEDAIIEQTMSDILFLTENHGKLSLDNVVAVPS